MSRSRSRSSPEDFDALPWRRCAWTSVPGNENDVTARRSTRGHRVVSLLRQPCSCAAALAFIGEVVPSLEFRGPPGERVLEPMKSAAALDGDFQAVGTVWITDGADEFLHVAISAAGTKVVDREPPVGVVIDVIVAQVPGVFDHHRRPDLSGGDVEPPTAGQWITFQHHCQLLEIDR